MDGDNTNKPSRSHSLSSRKWSQGSIFKSISHKLRKEKDDEPLSPVFKVPNYNGHSTESVEPPATSPVADTPQQQEVGGGERRLSFLHSLRRKRALTTSSASPSPSPLTSTSPPLPTIYCKNKNRALPPKSINGLSDVKPLKYISFAVDTFTNDPPQLIPGKLPKKGNVEVKPDGSGLIVRKCINGSVVEVFIPHHDCSKRTEKSNLVARAPPPIVGTSGGEYNEQDSKNITIDKTTDPSHHISKTEQSHLTMDRKGDPINVPLDIVYTRCCHLREILPIPSTLKQVKLFTSTPIPFLRLHNVRPSMIEILSFADFLGIIPVQSLSFEDICLSSRQLRIILSSVVYSKYISKINLSNVIIDEEGWEILCWFLSVNRSLMSLDLTQAPPMSLVKKREKIRNADTVLTRMEGDEYGRAQLNWTLLASVTRERSLTQMNSENKQNYPKIEELTLNGCLLSDEQLKDLLIRGFPYGMKKVGLAHNKLTTSMCKIVGKWLLNPDVICHALDLSHNDLETKLNPFIEAFRQMVHSNQSGTHLSPSDGVNHMYKSDRGIRFLNLSSTKLTVSNSFISLLSVLTQHRLGFLDLSHLPQIFPDIIPHLMLVMPFYKHLRRLNLDHNKLSNESIIGIAELIGVGRNLGYLSMLGNERETIEPQQNSEDSTDDKEKDKIEIEIEDKNDMAAVALLLSVKASHTLTSLEVEPDFLPKRYQEALHYYCMKNMENVVYGHHTGDDSNDPEKAPTTTNVNDFENILEDLDYEPTGGNSGMQTPVFGKDIDVEDLENFSRILAPSSASSSSVSTTINKKLTDALNDVPQSFNINDFLKRGDKLQTSIKNTIEILFQMKEKGELSVDGKETLLRFYFIDIALSKALGLAKTEAEKKSKRLHHHHIDNENVNESDESSGLNTASTSNTNGNKEIPYNQSQANAMDTISPSFINYLYGNDSAPLGRDLQLTVPHINIVESDLIDVPQQVNESSVPTLSRTPSETSIHKREQEVEEGNIHKIGSQFIAANGGLDDMFKRHEEREKDDNSSSPGSSTDSIKSPDTSSSNSNSNSNLSGESHDNSTEEVISHDHDHILINKKRHPSLSGEEVKKLLLRTKGVGSVVEILNKLKYDGVDLQDVFRKQESVCGAATATTVNSHTLSPLAEENHETTSNGSSPTSSISSSSSSLFLKIDDAKNQVNNASNQEKDSILHKKNLVETGNDKEHVNSSSTKLPSKVFDNADQNNEVVDEAYDLLLEEMRKVNTTSSKH